MSIVSTTLLLAAISSVNLVGGAVAGGSSEIAQTRTVFLGMPFSVDLPVNAGTGLSWQLTKAPKFKVQSAPIFIDRPLPGASGRQIFVLIPLQGGTFILTWTLGRFASKPLRVLRLQVHVD